MRNIGASVTICSKSSLINGKPHNTSPNSESCCKSRVDSPLTRRLATDLLVKRGQRAKERATRRTVGELARPFNSSGVHRVHERSRWVKEGNDSTNGVRIVEGTDDTE